ncbi:MAG: hypothetical protein HQ500_09265 [Flavobacteriales bacterium]|nr:hypothetical protein [Flavobacteriales bacterium]
MRTLKKIALCALVLALSFPGLTQDDDQEKLAPRVSLNYVQLGNDSHVVKLKAFVRNGRERLPAVKMLVNLYMNEISKGGMMGSLATDAEGMCVFPLVNKFELARDTVDSFHFIARVINDPRYEDLTKEIFIDKALLEFEQFNADSVLSFDVRLSIPGDSERVGIAQEAIQVFVKRMYSLLPIGGDYLMTDEDGRLHVEFPQGIPGDEEGNVTLVIRVNDHSDFGTLEAHKIIDWGIPVSSLDVINERALWASGANAPIYLMITIIGMIIGIWTVIIYIGTRIVKMNSLGKKATSLLEK